MGRLTLPPRGESAFLARRFVRAELREGDVDVDVVLLLVSELVTNAVLHARSEVILSVEERSGAVRVEVSDASSAPAVPRLATLAAGNGRGLYLLEQLATRWGTEPRPGAGKTIWFELGTAAAMAPDAAVPVDGGPR